MDTPGYFDVAEVLCGIYWLLVIRGFMFAFNSFNTKHLEAWTMQDRIVKAADEQILDFFLRETNDFLERNELIFQGAF